LSTLSASALQIAVEDVAHAGDVNHYSAAKHALEAGEPLAPLHLLEPLLKL
jgi:hypothetical protein